MKAFDLDVCMPEFLNGRCQFDALETNRSRFIDKIRWVVESANSRIYYFNLLNQTIQNSTIPQILDYLQIACALVNVFRTPAKFSSSNDDQIAANMLACLHEPNLLPFRFSNEALHWSNYDALDLIDFSVLIIDEIRQLTVGR